MRIAIIDLGTNSVRFDIHSVDKRGNSSVIHREKLMVRLGEGVFVTGKLNPQARKRTLLALRKFKKTATELKAQKIVAQATSALREAKDRDRFISAAAKLGVPVRVISGAEEARLIALGILKLEKLGKGRVALVDIGGGSTEISICRDKKVQKSFSFPMGVARLQQIYLKQTPPKKESLRALRLAISSALRGKIAAENWPKTEQIIGSSGTIRALAKLTRKGGKNIIERKSLQKLISTMSEMTLAELARIPGMEAKRIDLILAGAILLDECMGALGAKKVITTDYSLRDGILMEAAQVLAQRIGSQFSLHEAELFDKATQLGCDRRHLARIAALAEGIFMELAGLHHLKPSWKIYFVAAAILRKTGAAINPLQQEIHSYYIARHADLPGIENWEQEFIAQLCLRAAHEKPGGKVPDPFTQDRARLAAFKKLLALLKVVDALDSGTDFKVTLRGSRKTARKVRLLLARRGASGLEPLNLQLRGKYFRKIFRKTIEAEFV